MNVLAVSPGNGDMNTFPNSLAEVEISAQSTRELLTILSHFHNDALATVWRYAEDLNSKRYHKSSLIL